METESRLKKTIKTQPAAHTTGGNGLLLKPPLQFSTMVTKQTNITDLNNNTQAIQKPFAATDQTGKPVQRQVVRDATDEQRIINLTSTVTAFTDFGTTYVRLNGTELPGNAGFANAVAAPEYAVAPSGDNEYTARVTAAPVNHIGCRIALPTAPEWETGIALNNLSGRIDMMRGQPINDDDFMGTKPGREVLLYVKGRPDDDTFAGLVRQHELVHAGDIDTAVDNSIRPWDVAIQHAVDNNTGFRGDSVETARAAMWTALGGTAGEVGVAFRGELERLGNHYHHQAQGGRPTINRVEGRKRTFLRDIVRIHFNHPLAG